jgi:hypothetical protein
MRSRPIDTRARLPGTPGESLGGGEFGQREFRIAFRTRGLYGVKNLYRQSVCRNSRQVLLQAGPASPTESQHPAPPGTPGDASESPKVRARPENVEVLSMPRKLLGNSGRYATESDGKGP